MDKVDAGYRGSLDDQGREYTLDKKFERGKINHLHLLFKKIFLVKIFSRWCISGASYLERAAASRLSFQPRMKILPKV